MLAEDSAALVGLLVAALGIYASHRFDMPEVDGAASIVIGLLLAAVALALVREARGLLIGEGIRTETANAIREMAMAQPNVRHVGHVLSMYLGPDEVLVTVDIDFTPTTLASEAGKTVARLQQQVRERYPMIQRLFIDANE